MGFINRLNVWVGIGALGFGAAGCGQVESSGGDEPGDGEPGLPALTDSFAFAKSGERVQAVGYTSDGANQFRTLHDQLLGFDCEFVNGQVCGDLRCAPKRRARLIFLDTACSQPATWIEYRDAHPGDWVSVSRASSECVDHGNRRELYEIAEEIYAENAEHAPLVYELQGTKCELTSPPAKSSPAVNRLIPHAIGELVAARSVSFEVGGGLRLSRLLGEDGSELTSEITNASGQVCKVQSDGKCVPLGEDATGAFPVTQRIRQGSGSAHVDLFSSSPGPGRAGVPVALFPEVWDFVDDAGYRCLVVPAVDGTLRCAPLEPVGNSVTAYESGLWADSACSKRLHLGYPAGVDASLPRVRQYTNDALLAAVFTVKAYDGPVYTMNGETCVSEESTGDLLLLDRRTEASALPRVFETTL